MITGITVTLHHDAGPPTVLELDAGSDETSVEYLRRLHHGRAWITVAGPVATTTDDRLDRAEAAHVAETERHFDQDGF